MLNTGGASCIRHCWCSTKHRHDRGCAHWAFGYADRRMLRRFEIICFTNNSNPHAFLFLSDQLGHILEKEEEFSWGRKKGSVWWHDTSYVFHTTYVFSLGRQKCSVWWHDTSYRPRTLHTAFVRESRFICKCHIFVRTFRWSLWFSSSQPLNLPSEDKKKGWCYYLRNLTVCSAPYKWQLSACVDREDIYRFISRWQQPRTVFRDKLILFL